MIDLKNVVIKEKKVDTILTKSTTHKSIKEKL